MAELGAHLATATTDFPSIFEVLAQENLSCTLRPAFAHFVKVFAQKYPEKLGWIYILRDELYALLDTILQHHFLKTRGASFAEDFYGLKRVVWSSRVTQNNGKTGKYALPLANHLKALGCLVLAPYTKTKLESFLDEREGQINRNNSGRFEALVRFLRLLHFVWEVVGVVYLVGYSVGKNPFATPLLHLANTKLQTLSDDDNHDSSQNDSSKVGNVIVKAFSIATFFLQFIDWWYISGNALAISPTSSTSGTSHIQPPNPMIKNEGKVKTGICPICEQVIRNPTVLSNSGFVFCYSCIHAYVEKEHFCPVTDLPTAPKNLVRLYASDSQ